MTATPASVYLQSSGGVKYRALSPLVISEYLTSRRLPVTFLGKANSFLSSVLGPGIGWILLRRSEIDAIDWTATSHSLIFEASRLSVEVSDLHIYDAVAVSGTQSSQSLDCYLVELRDKRELCKWTTLNTSYNVRTPDWADTAGYYEATLDGGTPWTWSSMIEDIWGNISGLGGALTTTLMEIPVIDPENFVFPGVSALEAIEHICKHTNNHLVLKRDGTFHIIAQGDSDVANTTLLTTHATKALNPSSPKYNNGVRVPQTVKVYFPHLNPAFQNETNDVNTGTDKYYVRPVHVETVLATTVVPGINVLAGGIATIHDSLPALYNEAGTLQNGTDLADQAEKRALEFVNGLRQLAAPRDDIFHAAIPFELGAAIPRIHWYDFGDGIRTEAMSTPKNPHSGTHNTLTGVNETPGIPDLGRWHLPFERFAVGKVYNADIDVDSSGIVRILWGSHTSSSVTDWAETDLPHEVRAFNIMQRCYKMDSRVILMFHRQSSRWLIIGSGKQADAVDVVVDVSWDGSSLKQTKRPVFLEFCDDTETTSTIDDAEACT